MRINILTLFPAFFREPLATSIPGAWRRPGSPATGWWTCGTTPTTGIAPPTTSPTGGGRDGPQARALLRGRGRSGPEGPIVLLSPRGRVFSHDDAVRFAVQPELTLLCGHYKDVDQRVAEHLATEEISLGDFVLSGGEIPALAITDAVVRLLPGAMGDHDSAASDSFYDGPLLSPPSWTRPAEYRGTGCRRSLRSGDHARIEAFRRGLVGADL
jgi:tRNA (guanine37-N1)-methyltransferase